MASASASASLRTPDRGIDGFPVRQNLKHMKEQCDSVAGENCGCYTCVERGCLERRRSRMNKILRDKRTAKIKAMRTINLNRAGLGPEISPRAEECAVEEDEEKHTDAGETDSNASQAGFSDQEEIGEEDAAHLGGETFTCGDCGNVYSLGAQCSCGY